MTVECKISVGEIFKSNTYGIFKVVQDMGRNTHGHSIYTVEFVATGYRTQATQGSIKTGCVKDAMRPSVCGVGFLGVGPYGPVGVSGTPLDAKLRSLWTGMLARCYKPNSPGYNRYGYKGVSVNSRWHNYTNFYNDVKFLDGYDEFRILNGTVVLDKDKHQLELPIGLRVYSKDTCCFITPEDNLAMRDSSPSCSTFIVTHPSGIETQETNIKLFASRNELSAGCISQCLQGRNRQHKGYRFRREPVCVIG